MTNDARFKINMNTGEIEFEGSEDFVKEQLSKLPDTIKTILISIPHKLPLKKVKDVEPETKQEAKSDSSTSDISDIPDNFGEWTNRFPAKNISQVDHILIAGYFCQKQSDTNSFKTIYVNTLLKEQSIKITNPSECARLLLANKTIFTVSKGKKKGATSIFRVSKSGEEYIRSLLEKSP